MQLDIRTGEEETRLTVTLKDGYLPVVGDHRIDSSAADPDSRVHIEPAIWFKVLVLDSVVIDCPKRAIMWNSDPNTALGSELKRSPGKSTRASKGADHDEESPLQKRKRISQSMYIGGEFYGFESELDELFDTMQETLKFFSEANIDSARFYETVMRMLHCHVLPAISLTEEDSARLEFILKQQETLIERVRYSVYMLQLGGAFRVLSARSSHENRLPQSFQVPTGGFCDSLFCTCFLDAR